jgi:hypothetical protein
MDMKNIRAGAAPDTDYSGGSQPRRLKTLWILLGLVIVIVLATTALLSTTNNKRTSLPQADQAHSTVFQGMNSFIDSGLTTDQVNGLIKAFSKFSPKAQEVSIDTSSLSPDPHDPNSSDPSFTITFNVNIDALAYTGIASYSGLDTVRLFLNANGGNQVYDSGIINQSATNPDYSSGSTE